LIGLRLTLWQLFSGLWVLWIETRAKASHGLSRLEESVELRSILLRCLCWPALLAYPPDALEISVEVEGCGLYFADAALKRSFWPRCLHWLWQNCLGRDIAHSLLQRRQSWACWRL
jgi:hypothetical protein